MVEFMTALTYSMMFVVGLMIGAVGMDLCTRYGGGDDDGLAH